MGMRMSQGPRWGGGHGGSRAIRRFAAIWIFTAAERTADTVALRVMPFWPIIAAGAAIAVLLWGAYALMRRR